MFAQFKNVVESLAQPGPSNANSTGSSTRSNSGSPSSSTKARTADSSGKPSPRRTSSSDSRSRSKLTLEDRLKATIAGGNSLEPSPEHSENITRNPTPPAAEPTEVPLPLSPPSSPTAAPSIPYSFPDPLQDHALHNAAAATDSTNAQPLPPETDATKVSEAGSQENESESMVSSISGPIKDELLEPGSLIEEQVDIEQVQMKLKLLEKRFADVSASYARLQAEKEEVDQVTTSFSPDGAAQGVSGVRKLVEELKTKEEIAQQEIAKLRRAQDDQNLRIQELRDVHRLESASQSEQIESLRNQLQESEKLQIADSARGRHKDDEAAALRKQLEEQKQISKEEEEKRTKAIGLLKSVRQKLVKTEKDKEEATKQLEELRAKERLVQSKEQTERSQWEFQLENLKIGKEKELREAKSAWEQNTAERISRLQEEAGAARKSMETELHNLRTEAAAEQTAKDSRISSLEGSIQSLSRQKDDLFDQLQLRSAELESSQSLLEVLQSRTKELEFRLRESSDHAATLREELSTARTNTPVHIDGDNRSNEEIARLLLETQGKYESRLSEARTRIRTLEKDRLQAEEDWNRGIIEKSQALEQLRHELDAKDKELGSLTNCQKDAGTVNSNLEASLKELNETLISRNREVEQIRSQLSIASEQEASLGQQLHDASEKIDALGLQLEGAKEREVQLKTTNKGIKEELRKVQSSVALLERQRNPGVGYWSSLGGERPQSPSDSRRSGSIESSNGAAAAFLQSSSEEEINYEYLRNVILQFLEHKDRRPSLVRVLTTILRFTPQETRRLIAKV